MNPGDPTYDEVMLWYNDVAAQVGREIAALDWQPLLQGRPFEVTSRPKTIDTLREKLQRDVRTPLQNVQDIAGVRFEAEMSIDEQDGVVNAICGLYGHDLDTSVRDMRHSPHSGYRAVHLWLRLPARVEVQVRTHLQGLWANTYELAADLIGREIRYGALPINRGQRAAVEMLQQMSIYTITTIEKDRNEISTLEAQEEDCRRGGSDPPLWLRRRLAKVRRRNLANETDLQNRLLSVQQAFVELREERG